MRLKRLTLKNWRNFRDIEFDVPERLFVIGPNASGKSNLLDSLKFLRQVASDGGGFQAAVKARGGMTKLRCLAAGNFNNGQVTIGMVLEEGKIRWTYEITFTSETKGLRRPILTSETIQKNRKKLLNRPDRKDKADPERMTQTFLEQVTSNREFRPVVEFLRSIRYFHPVPLLIRGAQAVRGNGEESSPNGDSSYGADFISRIARAKPATRDRRLERIRGALEVAVPQFESLKIKQDAGGIWHLQAGYKNWRPRLARQNEHDFSDGTLRLISLLWSLMELRGTKRNGLLLLEEPELSLHASIIRKLPGIFSRMCRPEGAQVLVTTHSDEILKDEGLGLNEVLVLKPKTNGTEAVTAASIEDVKAKIDAGLSLPEIVAPHTRPSMIGDFPRKAAEA